jgi:phosphoribosylaminoimidazolecarboxamide formyltransferase / IMP cyclohydrolase
MGIIALFDFMFTMIYPIKTALISVSDKTGIVEFAKFLANKNIKIISTGGTYNLLQKNNINVIRVEQETDFPEIMAGRVKTLHPKLHGGILGRDKEDEKVMKKYKINKIDLVVVNLYPFADTITQKDCNLEKAVENIDIGGPAMVRSAAKNFARVAVITDPADYKEMQSFIQQQKGANLEQRQKLSAKAFSHTAFYDGLVSNYLTSLDKDNKPNKYSKTINLQFELKQKVRYGENPHQSGSFYVQKNNSYSGICTAKQLHGKELSFNNINDTDTAIECVKEFKEPTCVIVKHANPCGVASTKDITTAYKKAYECDPESAFGGIIAFNRTLDEKTASLIIRQQFVEVIVAPTITTKAKETLKEKKNIRILQTGTLDPKTGELDFKKVTGGLLIQDKDDILYEKLQTVSLIQPTKKELENLIFAWKVAKFVKSNAIVYGKDKQTIGIGAGQSSRVNSARIAALKASDAKLDIAGSMMASDAFFPFADSIDEAAKNNIKAIIQPGGSIRDKEVIKAVDKYKMIMVFTNTRHFRH